MIVKFGATHFGFTMIEMILSLLCISMFIPLVVHGAQIVLFDQSIQVQEMEDMMGIEQLRLYLAQGNVTSIDNNCLYYAREKEYSLLLVNRNLTLRPGNLVFLTAIDEIEFYEEEFSCCMKYKKNGKWYDVWIGYPKRIY